MTDRPIIFSAPMVRALLAGTKTQTRRVLKPQPPERVSCFEPHPSLPNELIPWRDGEPLHSHVVPYAPGDRLWVRENFALGFDLDDHDMPIGDEPTPFFASTYDGRMWLDRDTDEWRDEPRWTPSIHMPRWASRLTLVVTGVRVQRLQEISEADAKAEGVRAPVNVSPDLGSTYTDGFGDLWEEIHGEGSWEANPWIVAITFAVRHTNIDAMEKAA